jgi:hypothetical protein
LARVGTLIHKGDRQMSTVTQCDRCGKIDPVVTKVGEGVNGAWSPWEIAISHDCPIWDLCQECLQEFRDFMKAKQEKERT